MFLFTVCQAETQRLKKEVIEKGKELQAELAPLSSLRSQRASLESEKRDKQGTVLHGQLFQECFGELIRWSFDFVLGVAAVAVGSWRTILRICLHCFVKKKKHINAVPQMVAYCRSTTQM